MSDDAIEQIEGSGFTVLGGFVPDRGDGVPDGLNGNTAAYVLLIGNAGPAMFERFAENCDPQTELLDDWCRTTLDPIAAEAGARSVYPWQKPFLPFLTWARKAGAGAPSPLGMNIHPVYGLWHGFRGAFIFERPPDSRPAPSDQPHPCQSCEGQPCLTSCPVDAFVNVNHSFFDSTRCVSHLQSTDGVSCLNIGCKARLACPIGKKYAYSQDQIRFHLSAFFRACTGA